MSDPRWQHLGEVVSIRRQQLGLTPAQAAHNAGLTANGWGRIEYGYRVRRKTLTAVEAALKWPKGHCVAVLIPEPTDRPEALR